MSISTRPLRGAESVAEIGFDATEGVTAFGERRTPEYRGY